MHQSIAELALLAGALVAAGILSGFLAGLFGVGGGAILVPVFYQVFGLIGMKESVSMHVAVASSLAIIVPTSIRSFLGHRAKGAVDMAVLRSWLLAVPLGAVAATVLAALVSGGFLRAFFAVFAALIAIKMLFGRQGWRLGEHVPTGPLQWGAGGAIGLTSGLIGVGGGVLSNLWLALFAVPIQRAVATSSGVGVLISIPGLVGYVVSGYGHPDLPPLSTGYVNWIAVAIVIPATLMVAPLGVRLAHSWPKRRLEIAFGLFLAAVSLRFAISLA